MQWKSGQNIKIKDYVASVVCHETSDFAVYFVLFLP